ncbi:MAG: dihydrofolate reductase family protein [Nocardioides sp.]|uniref:dihydrofolate reductase family protein n=1 Tax=Nocardioides sp. TaxID=35761 RepID=UPI0039E3660F
MARLHYSAICSLDGYVADELGRFDWAVPDAEVHAFVNDLERPIGTYLYGRRMYDVMAGWDIKDPDRSPESQEYAAIWQTAEKVVFSSTLVETWTNRTRLVRRFDPAVIRQLKGNSRRDLSVGGPTLAGVTLHAGLVDECHLIVAPVIVGGGLPVFPGHLRQPMNLYHERRFGNGMVYLRYRIPH